MDGKGNLLPINKVELGFRVLGLLSKLNKRDIITIGETKKIKEVQCFVVSTLKKILDRSPFTCEFVRYCPVLNPVILVSCEHESCQKHFKLLLKACVCYFLTNFYFSPNDSTSKTMKYVFYFI